MSFSSVQILFLLALTCIGFAPPLRAQESVDEVDRLDVVNQFWDKVRKQEFKFDHASSPQSVLKNLLEALEIPIASQVLVYSKTSLQNFGIHPKTPRAIYFNEHAYVGYVQGGELEIIAMDPVAGPQYYLIPLKSFLQSPSASPPVLLRAFDCQSCHMDPSSAIQVLSVKTNSFGSATSNDTNLLTTFQSDIEERWGGWYVTGGVKGQEHMGNWMTLTDQALKIPVPQPSWLKEEDLAKFFDVKPYLTSSSDVLALMVLEHQSVMHNTLAAAGLAVQRVIRRAEGDLSRASVKRATQLQARKIVEALLQIGDAGFEGVIEPGSSAFETAFLESARPDAQKRSLRDFQYEGRLFKYRCSYMIYTPSFMQLPHALRKEVYQRLKSVLSNAATDDDFHHLSLEERRAIAEILQDTHEEFKATWMSGSKP